MVRNLLTTVMIFICSIAFSQVNYPCGVYFSSTYNNALYGAWTKCYPTGDFTMAAWIQLRDSVWAGKEMDIFQREDFDFTSTDRLNLYLAVDGQLKFRTNVNRNGGSVLDSVSSGVKPDPFKWYHVAVSFTATGECTLFVNGNASGGKSFGGPRSIAYPYNDFLTIGGRFNPATFGYDIKTYRGYMDEVAFASKAFNESQIRILANGLQKGDAFLATNQVVAYDKEDTYPGVVNSGIGTGQVGLVGQLRFCPDPPVTVVDPNPSIVGNDGLLDPTLAGLDFNKFMKGAATDGITKLLIVKAVKNNNPITFSGPGLKDGTFSSLINQNSKLNSIVITPIDVPGKGKYAIAIYNAPDGYGSNWPSFAASSRDVTITVTNSESIVIKLVSPPVIMVHGMWSNPDVWQEGKSVYGVGAYNTSFAYFLRNYNNSKFNLFFADYKADNFRTFDPLDPESRPGRLAVKKAIDEGFLYYKNMLGIAVSQADIIGHSLGGLLTRSFAADKLDGIKYFEKENYNKGYVHKLITLGTPHKGSPMGGFLIKYSKQWAKLSEQTVLKINTLQNLLDWTHHPIGSCHSGFDYTTNKTPYINLGTTPPFKTFAIAGNHLADMSNSISGAGGELSLNVGLKFISGGSEDLNTIFKPLLPCVPNNIPVANDLIVTVNSQKGNGSKWQLLGGTGHSGPAFNTETNSINIFTKVYDLLLSDNPDDFGTGFPSPLEITEDCLNGRPAMTNPADALVAPKAALIEDIQNSGYIKISSPVNGYKVRYGIDSTIQLGFTEENGAKPQSGFFMIQGINDWIPVPEVAPFTITYKMPSSTGIGFLNIAAFSLDSSGLRMADTAHIEVLPPEIIDSLIASPASINLDSIKREANISMKVYYQTGADTILANLNSLASGIKYSSGKHESVFKVNAGGSIVAISAGVDTLTIEYNGKKCFVAVIVDSNFIGRSFKPDSISFTQEDKLINDLPFALNASASYSLPITYQLLSGPVTLSGDIVSIIDTGLVQIRASCTGNSYYKAAIPVTISFRINRIAQYKFVGNGSWQNAANWVDNKVPPVLLPKGSEIVINPATNAECVLDIAQTISKDAKFTVNTNAKLRVTGDLKIVKHGLGELYQGGIIFYMDSNGHGLICSPADIGAYPWDLTIFDPQNYQNYNPPLVGASATAIGNGYANTVSTVSKLGAGNYAAAKCRSYNGGGFADWYLPSKDELNLMYNNLKITGMVSFSSSNNYFYWSSSEIDNKNVWIQKFDDGAQQNFNWKNNVVYVRAIRAF